jgi:type II secretory pathway predicted ATPase ExeA
MYEQYYGLDSRPFDLSPDPRYLVPTPLHREAISNLEYGIASRKGITLLVGEAGTGKTTAIRAALEKQPTRTHCIHLHNPALTRDEFIKMLAAQFSLTPAAQLSKTDMLLELEVLLRRRREQQETTILVVDEAQSLPSELLEEIRLLTNIELPSEKLLPLIIAGQPEIAARLNHPSFSQLKQRIALRCELRPLTMRESAGYIAGRIRAAGGEPSQLFTREAVVVIHEHAHGIPRTINVLADNALLNGFAAQQMPVHTQLVSEVCRDFDLKAPRVVRQNQEPLRITTPRAAQPLSASDRSALDASIPVSQ